MLGTAQTIAFPSNGHNTNADLYGVGVVHWLTGAVSESGSVHCVSPMSADTDITGESAGRDS